MYDLKRPSFRLALAGTNVAAQLKLGFGIASPLFGGLLAFVTWAWFAYRYRARKREIVQATIVRCTDRDPNPTLPNPQRYELGQIKEDLGVLLKEVMAKWDSRLGCSPKLSFPMRADVGIWKRGFHSNESLVLVDALVAVDSKIRDNEGHDGLLDKWRRDDSITEVDRRHVSGQVCSWVERLNPDQWQSTRVSGAGNAPFDQL